MRDYTTFYVLDVATEHLVCIVKAFRFDIVKSHVLMICFYDDRDNVIAYFDAKNYIARDRIILFDGSVLTGEGLING